MVRCPNCNNRFSLWKIAVPINTKHVVCSNCGELLIKIKNNGLFQAINKAYIKLIE